GLKSDDMSEQAKTKRVLRGLADLEGITFVAKIQVEPSRNPSYRDANKLDHVVLPSAPEWQKVMNGEDVPPQPSNKTRAAVAAQPAAPAWGQPQTPAAPAWGGQALRAQPAQPAAATPATPASGPAWLNP